MKIHLAIALALLGLCNLSAEEYNVVSGAVPIVVQRKPGSIVGISAKKLIDLRGEPQSRISAGNRERLLYSDFIYEVQNGTVVEVHQRMPRNVRSSYASSMNPPTVKQESASASSASSGSGVSASRSASALREQLIAAAKPKVHEWAQKMTYSTREWYYENFVQNYESFEPVAGWPNRYCLLGTVHVYSKDRNSTVRFEALIQLLDNSEVKSIEVSLRH